MATACPRLMPTISPCTLHDARGSGVSLILRRGTRAEGVYDGGAPHAGTAPVGTAGSVSDRSAERLLGSVYEFSTSRTRRVGFYLDHPL